MLINGAAAEAILTVISLVLQESFELDWIGFSYFLCSILVVCMHAVHSVDSYSSLTHRVDAYQ